MKAGVRCCMVFLLSCSSSVFFLSPCFLWGLGIDDALNGALIGFFASAGFVFSLSGATGLFSEVSLKLHFIDNGYHVVGLTLAGLVIGWW